MKQLYIGLIIGVILGMGIMGAMALPDGGMPTDNFTTGTANITETDNITYISFKSVSEIRQFVKDSGFSDRAYKFGVYDCITHEGGLYFGFALDFCEYARTQNRLFVPFADFRGGKTWHLKTITFIGNNVYSVDPIYYDGRVYLFGKVD